MAKEMIREFQHSHARPPHSGAFAGIAAFSAYSVLKKSGVSQLYPDFEEWFMHRVLPGVLSGERRILTHVKDATLTGIAICKRSDHERKLCTLWVSPQVRGHGIATALAGEAFEWLGTTKPLFTVPEERLEEFGRLLGSWSFERPIEYHGLYRPQRTEYVFNGKMNRDFH